MGLASIHRRNNAQHPIERDAARARMPGGVLRATALHNQNIRMGENCLCIERGAMSVSWRVQTFARHAIVVALEPKKERR